MSPEKIHALIHSLSKEQKTYFRRFSKSSKKTLDIILYDRFLKEKALNKTALKRIRGKEFEESRMFYFYRVALGEKIIASLVSLDGESTSPIRFIEKAFAEDAVELGERALKKEMAQAIELEDFSRLQYLHQLKEQLESSFKLKIELEPKFLDHDQCQSRIQEIADVKVLQSRISASFALDFHSKTLVANSIRAQLDQVEVTSSETQIWKQKIATGLYILKEDYALAFATHNSLVDYLISRKFFPLSPIQSIEEVNLAIRLAVLAGFRKESFELIQILESIDVKHRREARHKEKENITTAIYVADNFADLALMRKAFTQFEDRIGLFPQENQSFNYFLAGVTFLFNQQYEEAIEALQKVKAIPSRKWKAISWEPDLILALAYLGIEKFNYFESAIRSAEKRARNHPSAYPSLAISTVKNTYFREGYGKLELHKDFEKISSLLQDPTEKRAALLVDIRYWILGSLENTLPADYCKETGKSVQTFAS